MITLKQAETFIAELVNFQTPTLSGRWGLAWNNEPTYLVYSYGVAIGSNCLDDSGKPSKWGIVPDIAYTYSKTTSKHANIVKRAWQYS
jgi:hypothetical protein